MVANMGRAARTESFTAIVGRLALAQKSSVGVSAYSRWINRPVGRQLAAIAFKAGLTPNQVTAISALFTFGGIVLLATVRATPGLGVLVTGLLVIGYAIDSADGQLARLRGGGTPAGEWLDHVVDCIKLATLHIAVLIGWFRFFALPSTAILLIPIAFAIEASVFFFTLILSEQLRKAITGDRSRAATGERHASFLRTLVVLPADYGVHAWIFVLWGVPTIFVPLYTALAAINVVLLIAGLLRWFREMRRLSTDRSS